MCSGSACHCPKPPAREIQLTDPWDYALLAEGVEAWGFRTIQDRGELLDRVETASLWLETSTGRWSRCCARRI